MRQAALQFSPFRNIAHAIRAVFLPSPKEPFFASLVARARKRVLSPFGALITMFGNPEKNGSSAVYELAVQILVSSFPYSAKPGLRPVVYCRGTSPIQAANADQR